MFRNVFLPVADMPEGYPFYIRHETPEVLWQEPLLAHPLGVEALAGCVVCVADLEEAAARYARFFGFPPEAEGRARVFRVPGARFALVDVDGLAEVLPGLRPPSLPWGAAIALTCRDPAAAAELLSSRGVAAVRRGNRVVIGPRPRAASPSCWRAPLGAERPRSGPRAGAGPFHESFTPRVFTPPRRSTRLRLVPAFSSPR